MQTESEMKCSSIWNRGDNFLSTNISLSFYLLFHSNFNSTHSRKSNHFRFPFHIIILMLVAITVHTAQLWEQRACCSYAAYACIQQVCMPVCLPFHARTVTAFQCCLFIIVRFDSQKGPHRICFYFSQIINNFYDSVLCSSVEFQRNIDEIGQCCVFFALLFCTCSIFKSIQFIGFLDLNANAEPLVDNRFEFVRLFTTATNILLL